MERISSEQDNPYPDFVNRLRLLISKNPEIITLTLSNIFTMRLIGNKTHGDLAEIAISEFINQYMYDFHSIHVGKDLYRAKKREEDIKVVNEITKTEFPISLKAYGNGPLQLSTNKSYTMFPRLSEEGVIITDRNRIFNVLDSSAFDDFYSANVLPLIYDEKTKRCNIMVFDSVKARNAVAKITRIDHGHGRKHPVYLFYDSDDNYICEVRYGGASANALQRGLWTHTIRAQKFFTSVTDGWIDYSHNKVLVKLFSCALVASSSGHQTALDVINEDISKIKESTQKR
ncbi:MAG: hypothetical protein F4065_02335 [Rhodothermaceae bacterium]|nr:hypothetical protein [Rhodothermaceae bacterium]MXZ57449.1 hypothetical protein [Rhodothermaceae bacterium]MYB90433.1 hypothetical protein [Rhodothermaceae bacterium]MYD68260.1 hypothetical protein [Rhodothermaceae bacterium]MYG44250.1 hypothetical protein [Rhodothermaceae bacterium]